MRKIGLVGCVVLGFCFQSVGAEDRPHGPPQNQKPSLNLCPDLVAGLKAELPTGVARVAEALRAEYEAAGMAPADAGEAAGAVAQLSGLLMEALLNAHTRPASAPAVPKSTPVPTARVATVPRPPFLVTFAQGDYTTADPFTTPLVPWLATEGPFAFTVEKPPVGDPRHFGDLRVALRDVLDTHHGAFGAYHGAAFEEFFWKQAQGKRLQRVAVHEGRLESNGRYDAPVAVYFDPDEQHYVLLQHGNHQFLKPDQQPNLLSGKVRLYRGVYDLPTHQVPILEGKSASETAMLRRYQGLFQWYIDSRTDAGFSVPYAGSTRNETNHISLPIHGMAAFDKFAGRFFTAEEIKLAQRYIHPLPHHHGNRWTFDRNIAELRFGPNVVAIETDLTNIRFTGYWNSEAETHLIDQERFVLVPAASTRGMRVARVQRGLSAE